MTALELLTAAQVRIAEPEKWTEGAYARAADGRRCFPESERATRWSAFGALLAEGAGGDDYRSAAILMRQAARRAFDADPEVVNDRHGHGAVMRMFADAIALAGEGR